MNKMYSQRKAFTLIEILVSITILSIIMVSVMSIFISTSDINMKTDIMRALQQNVKSVTETIAEDVRKNWFEWVQSNGIDDCAEPTGYKSLSGTLLCTVSWKYYLAKETVPDTFTHVGPESCSEIDSHCTLVKDGAPLMNSWVDIKDLKFIITGEWVEKVTLLMKLQPALWKWIKPNLIKSHRFDFQTSFVERPTLN